MYPMTEISNNRSNVDSGRAVQIARLPVLSLYVSSSA
ncbi:hypothetical protein BKP42_43380 [Rhodococcus erythropolis]|nr:hypothetical protein BKP42_43380 [Rhodococcus erythropolis]